MSHRLTIKRLTGFEDIERFYRNFVDCLANPDIQQLEFDLAGVTFMTPEAVLALLCAARYWYDNRGCAVTLTSLDPEVHHYLDRINLLEECRAYLSTSGQSGDPWTRSNSANLLEITSIPCDPEVNSQTIYTLYARVQTLLLGRLENRRLQAACDLLNVVIENITHSQDVGHVLLQCYSTGNTHRIHIGIADLGLGIPETLRTRYADLGKESDYLLKSLDAGVTSRSGSGGLGLYNVNRIIRGQQGSLTIRSGRAMLQVYANHVYSHDNLVRIPGTQVFMSVWGNHDAGHWNYLLPEQ